jgi:hypothetical protein
MFNEKKILHTNSIEKTLTNKKYENTQLVEVKSLII